ncbi:hypothetical protein CMV_030635 [Castanea mollissima]|uniref:Uncharacterized protein n=1 Tax=Castanea mollissima TaxID=60419 RepID=A0A8J4Q3Y0_9ROSI|nr:hypothetical protein CMV_030635 [Castanea mollissima]
MEKPPISELLSTKRGKKKKTMTTTEGAAKKKKDGLVPSTNAENPSGFAENCNGEKVFCLSAFVFQERNMEDEVVRKSLLVKQEVSSNIGDNGNGHVGDGANNNGGAIVRPSDSSATAILVISTIAVPSLVAVL